MKYEKPNMELVELEMVDIITVSDPEYVPDDEPSNDTPENW